MPNPPNMTNLSVNKELYSRLEKLKLIKECSFNQLIDDLCELEFENNYIINVIEYSLITEHTSRLFRITFKKENMVIEYYHPKHGYNNKIDNWELDKKTTDKFYEFIREDYARCLLEHIPVSIEFKDFIISKI